MQNLASKKSVVTSCRKKHMLRHMLLGSASACAFLFTSITHNTYAQEVTPEAQLY